MAADAGWYADPQGPGRRWWDGRAWTEYVDDVDAVAFAPIAPATPPAAASVAPPLPTWGPPPVGVWRGPVDDRPWVRTVGDAIRTVLAKYAQFDGRAGLAEFWFWSLFVALCYVGAVVALLIPIVGFVVALALFAGALAIIVPNYAVAVRRLRDAGFRWAWMFLGLVPFGGIALLVMWAMPSKFP